MLTAEQQARVGEVQAALGLDPERAIMLVSGSPRDTVATIVARWQDYGSRVRPGGELRTEWELRGSRTGE
jgi:hypothetical protein